MKIDNRRHFAAAVAALALTGNTSFAAFASAEPAQMQLAELTRSTNTHAIPDDLQRLEEKSPTKAASKNAERQIKESPDKGASDDDSAVEPSSGGGAVIVSPKLKIEAANAASQIVDHESNDPASGVVSNVQRPTLALAFGGGGGGARGAAHIGVLKVLAENNIPIDYIVGNSMGAIVGGLYAGGTSLDDIAKMLESGSLRKAYMPGWVPAHIALKPVGKLVHPFQKHYAGLWSGKKLGQFLEKNMPPGVTNVEDTRIPFSAVATNLIDGKAYRISNGNMVNVLRASSSIAPILRPVAIEDKVYVDGGVRANLPASAARDTGADVVVAVLVDEPLVKVPPARFRHLKGIANRLTDIVLAVADERQLQFADVIINPDVSGIRVLSKKGTDVSKAIAAGEAATRKALPEILKRLGRPAHSVAQSQSLTEQ